MCVVAALVLRRCRGLRGTSVMTEVLTFYWMRNTTVRTPLPRRVAHVHGRQRRSVRCQTTRQRLRMGALRARDAHVEQLHPRPRRHDDARCGEGAVCARGVAGDRRDRGGAQTPYVRYRAVVLVPRPGASIQVRRRNTLPSRF